MAPVPADDMEQGPLGLSKSNRFSFHSSFFLRSVDHFSWPFLYLPTQVY